MADEKKAEVKAEPKAETKEKTVKVIFEQNFMSRLGSYQNGKTYEIPEKNFNEWSKSISMKKA